MLILIALIKDKTKTKSFTAILIIYLLISSALYLFLYGSLGEFSLESVVADARFVKEKANQAEQDQEEILKIRKKAEETAEEVQRIVNKLKSTDIELSSAKNELISLQSDLSDLMVGVVEIFYLISSGHHMFPNPYVPRINKRMNEIIQLAEPDPEKRESLIKELNSYIESKRLDK